MDVVGVPSQATILGLEWDVSRQAGGDMKSRRSLSVTGPVLSIKWLDASSFLRTSRYAGIFLNHHAPLPYPSSAIPARTYAPPNTQSSICRTAEPPLVHSLSLLIP